MVGARPCRTRPDRTVGRVLEEARCRQGLLLEDAATQLHIPAKHLRALEEGNLSVFPAEIYARGAFRKYATFLGVAAESYNRAFQRTLSGARELVPLRVHTPRPWLEAVATPRLFLALGLGALAFVVGGYVAWQVASFVRLPALAVNSPESVVLSDDVVRVAGTAAEDAEITVNGEQVLLTQAGTFETNLYVHEGVNVVRVQATNAAGRSKVIQKDVLVPR